MSTVHYLYPDTLLIIFAREPSPGKVKTRLIPALGEEKATRLYQQFLEQTINKHTTSSVLFPEKLAPVSLCITPESSKEYFVKNGNSRLFQLTFQSGRGLGDRMYNALEEALETYTRAILIGTDCPLLSQNDIHQAITALDTNDMVFSPASDGGYVLTGAKTLHKGVFDNINWGTELVMSQSRQQMSKLGVSWHELSEQNDIDVESDLRYISELTEYKEYFF